MSSKVPLAYNDPARNDRWRAIKILIREKFYYASKKGKNSNREIISRFYTNFINDP